MRTLGADFVTGGTVKYLLASAGLGFLWIRGEVLAGLTPTQTGWFADEDIFQMDISDYVAARDRAPVRRRHAARAEHLRGASRGSASRGDGRSRDRGSTATA